MLASVSPHAELSSLAARLSSSRFYPALFASLRKACGPLSLSLAWFDERANTFRSKFLHREDGADAPLIDAETAMEVLSSQSPFVVAAQGVIVLPLRAEGAKIGYLAASTPQPRGFDARDVIWLSAAADVAALVVRAASADDAAAARGEDIRLLLKTARALASERDLEHLFERFYELVRNIMDATSFVVALGSWADGQMTIPFAVDEGKRLHLGGPLPIEGSLTGYVFREGTPLIIRTLADFDVYPGIIRGEGEETQSALVVPMRIEDRTIGVISVQSIAPNSYGGRERDLLAAIAEQAAIAVENSQHLSNSEQRARELKLLAEVARALSTQLSINELCRTVCGEVRRVMDAPVFMVALRADEADLMRLVYCVQQDSEMELASYSLENSIAKRVIELNQAIVLQTKADLENTPHRYLQQDDRGGIRSVAMAPLRLGDRCIGVMSAQSYRDGAFDDSSVRLLTAIGEQMALAVQNAELFHEARNRADRDPLTNLFHHRYLKTRLQEEVAGAESSGAPLAVLMLDLDNFKLVNDTYGHLVGDEALRLVTGVLQATCRGSDIIGRYGGDEFMVILPDTSPAQAGAIAQRVDREMAARHLQTDHASIPLRCSIGVSTYPRDGLSGPELVARADAALYQSKRAGLPVARMQRVGHTHMRLEGDFAPVAELLAALLARDPSTRSHLEHVNRLAQAFASALDLSDRDRSSLLLASVLHDVGKIAIPDGILRKPGRLSADESTLVRRHPVIGAMLLEHIPGFADAAIAVRHHHERYDGNGYPDRLAGTGIPLAARIVTLIDAFSAMTVDRPYHKGLEVDDAVRELRRCAGTQFCPELVERFAAIVAAGGGR